MSRFDCKPILFLALACACVMMTLAGQEAERTPELEKKLSAAQGKERVDLLNELALACARGDQSRARQYMEQALGLAEKLNYGKGKGDAYFAAARICWLQDRWDETIAFCRQAKNEADHAGDALGWARAAELYGRAHMEKNDFHTALKEFLEVLDRIQNVAHNEKELIRIHFDLNFVYQKFKNLEKAGEHIKKGLDLAEKTKDHYHMGLLLLQRGIWHAAQKKTSVVLSDYQSALNHFSAIHDEKDMAATKLIIAGVLHQKGQDVQVLKLYKETAEYFRRTQNNFDLRSVLILLGQLYTQMKQYSQADACYQEALALAESFKVVDYKIHTYKMYSDYCYSRGRFREAYDYYQKYNELRNEIHSRENEKQIIELNAKHEMETRKKEIALLQKDNKIKRMTRNSALALLFAVVLGASLFFRKYLYLLAFWRKQKYIGQYRVTGTLGSGGMGVVYKAHPVKDKNTVVAIKVLKDELWESDAHKRRFKREGTIADRVNHPNIVKVFERGEVDGKLFIVMEYVPGQTLAQLIGEQGALPLAICLHIMRQICGALRELHGQNILHRDLKPSNILVGGRHTDSWHITLLDFGLAKVAHHSNVTVTGEMIGTLAYAAPEVITQQEATPAADIYTLGLIFHELLTGKALYQGEKLSPLIDRILHHAPVPLASVNPSLPHALSDLVQAMQAKEPRERPVLDEIIEKIDQVLVKNIW